MNQNNFNTPGEKRYSRMFVYSAAFAVLGVTLLLFMVLAFTSRTTAKIGPVQPIPFSHRIHATEKRISCVFCHSGAIDTDVAGIPPLETCMLCHSKIIIKYPQIAGLRDNYYNKIPVEWVRINVLQEFVYFSHQTHIQSGVDCGKCHGNVAGMDRVVMKKPFIMGFCVQCHRDTKVSFDCLRCHR
jgi:predicted CXXCH cytochrome family protein